MSEAIKTVGMIGLGKMGQPMARLLASKGFKTVGYDVSEAARQRSAKNNVEIAAAQVVGRETVDYVSNIYKYYVAYRFSLPQLEGKSEAIEAVQP